MQHVPHPACTHELMPAPGTEADVDSLFIKRHTQRVTVGLAQCVTSYWKPSPEELLALNSGAHVALTVLAVTHPPVRIGVEP